MKDVISQEEETSSIEMAAGGLVWRRDAGGVRLAIVHRKKHGDWTLPKGRQERGENLQETALREAMEETGWMAQVRGFAGTYSYLKDKKPKMVLVWHMLHRPEPYAKPALPDEIDKVAWLTTEEALDRLKPHPSERDFVARHGAGPGFDVSGTRCYKEPELQRLAAAIHAVRRRYQAHLCRPTSNADTWWLDCARNSLEAAEADLLRCDRDGGWGALHDAERFMVFGMSHPELLARAATLREETQSKLKGWRAAATAQLFAFAALAEWIKPPYHLKVNEHALLQQVVVEALGVLHEDGNNKYHRLRLVGRQLRFLIVTCGVLLSAALASSTIFLWACPDSTFGIGYLGPVVLAGALGGVVSAMFKLSRVGEAKIPEALLHGLITSGRPLVGAACALFLYAVLQSNVISLIDSSKVTLAAALVMGFAAGFSEGFVLSTVSKVTGSSETKEPVSNVLPGSITNGTNQNPKAPGPAPSTKPPGGPPSPGKAKEEEVMRPGESAGVKEPDVGN